MTKRCETNENDVFQTNKQIEKKMLQNCSLCRHLVWTIIISKSRQLPNAGLIHFFYYYKKLHKDFLSFQVYNVDVL